MRTRRVVIIRYCPIAVESNPNLPALLSLKFRAVDVDCVRM